MIPDHHTLMQLFNIPFQNRIIQEPRHPPPDGQVSTLLAKQCKYVGASCQPFAQHLYFFHYHRGEQSEPWTALGFCDGFSIGNDWTDLPILSWLPLGNFIFSYDKQVSGFIHEPQISS